MSRLKSQWLDEHQNWQRQDLSQKRYVYWWADGIYSQVRMDDRLCLLVIIGVTEHGHFLCELPSSNLYENPYAPCVMLIHWSHWPRFCNLTQLSHSGTMKISP